MLKIWHISDTHTAHNLVSPPDCDVDITIHSGDMTLTGQVNEFEDFFTWFAQQPGKVKIVVPGNHDRTLDPLNHRYDEQRAKEIIDLYNTILPKETTHLLINCSTTISIKSRELKVHGIPHTPAYGHGWGFQLVHHVDKFSCYKHIPNDTEILVCHGPVKGIRDFTTSGIYAGCELLLQELIHLPKLKAFCFGHIHERSGIDLNLTGVFGNNFVVSNGCVSTGRGEKAFMHELYSNEKHYHGNLFNI